MVDQEMTFFEWSPPWDSLKHYSDSFWHSISKILEVYIYIPRSSWIPFFQPEAEKAEISARAGFLARGCFFSPRPYIADYKNIGYKWL